MNNDRHALVERRCEYCGSSFMARVERVNAGQGRFCSLKCANATQREEGRKTWGYSNGIKYWAGKYWSVRWKDENGKPHNTPYPRWWWTLNVGEVPNGYGVSYKDGNPENLDSDNFYLVSLKEISRQNGHKSLGKPRPDVAGKNNKWWRGGSSYEGYPFEFSKALKKRIKIRDGYTCQCCFSTYATEQLDVHHKDVNRRNNVPENLVTVCKSCHKAIHGWVNKTSDKIKYYQSLLPEEV